VVITVLVLFSAFCFGAAVWRHLEPGVPLPRIQSTRTYAMLTWDYRKGRGLYAIASEKF
jgi:hypothetical protein